MEERRQRHECRNHVASVQVEKIDAIGEVSGARCLGEVDRSHRKRKVIGQQQDRNERHKVKTAGKYVHFL